MLRRIYGEKTMSDIAWSMIVIVLVVVIFLILVKDWRLGPEEPPPHSPDSAVYKRGS